MMKRMSRRKKKKRNSMKERIRIKMMIRWKRLNQLLRTAYHRDQSYLIR